MKLAIATGFKDISHAFNLMNPGNGIETSLFDIMATVQMTTFNLMNPGNGIETIDFIRRRGNKWPFNLMNPGNGIETLRIANSPGSLELST